MNGLPLKLAQGNFPTFRLHSQAGFRGEQAFHQLLVHELDAFQVLTGRETSLDDSFQGWDVMVSFNILTLLTALAQTTL